MNKIIKLISIVAITLLSSLSIADHKYIGLNISSVDLVKNASPTFDIATTNLVLGKSLSDNISAELRYGSGIFKDTLNVSSDEISAKVKKSQGVYVKYNLPLTNGLNSYAIIGYTEATIDYAGSETSESDISTGLGINFGATDSSSFNIEYVNFINTSNIFMHGISFGFNSTF